MAIPRNLANIAPHVAGSSGGITGLTFNATQSASADANTLDDYEEGTWTPTFAGGLSPGTYTLSNINAYYTKIGNQVTAYAYFGFSAASGGSPGGVVSGLPFSYKASSRFVGSVLTANLNTSAATSNGIAILPSTLSSATSLYFALNIDNSASEEILATGFTTSTIIQFTVTYTVS
jgi:hypothetical protein